MTPDKTSQNEMLSRYKEQLLSIFSEEINDENMRIFIFKDSDYKNAIKKKETNYVSYMDNILTLAFVFAYGCYKYDCDNTGLCFKVKKPNSIRMIDNFKHAFFDHPITLEYTQYMLCDIMVYMQQMSNCFNNGSDLELYKVFANLSTFPNNFNLMKYFEMVSKKRAIGARANFNVCETAKLFCELVNNLPFLKNYNLVQDENGQFSFCRKNKYGSEDYDIIPVKHILHAKYYEEIFSLFSFEKIEKGRKKCLKAHYISSGNSNTLNYTVCSDKLDDDIEQINYDAEDFLYEITGTSWDRDEQNDYMKKDSYLIHHIHAINYKYIKNLALSISDAMIMFHNSREKMYELFSEKFPDIFARVKDIDSVNDPFVDWDGIIVMLLIEASPSKVLECLFENIDNMFYYVVASLCKRINDPEMPICNLNNDELDKEVKAIIKKNLIVGEAGGFGKLRGNDKAKRDKKMFAHAAAILIISSLSSVLDDHTICAGNIYDNEVLLRDDILADCTNEVKTNDACIILGETFKHLLCFYKGVVAYGKEKMIIDALNFNRIADSNEIATYQNNLKRAFLDAARAEMNAIKHLDTSCQSHIAELIIRFLDFSNECASGKGSSGDSNGLYYVTGKYDILDVHAFKKGCGTLIEDLKDEIIADGDELIQIVLKVLHFLTTGSFKKGSYSELDAIYPFTAIYNRGVDNYDGYKSFTFTLNLKRDARNNSSNDINVLTEYKFNLCDVFYCLPNTLRSNKRWWIDPLLINFKEFNDIFSE